MRKPEFPYGIRMKGGVAFDEEVDGFVAIVHSWDNVDCLGKPTEWQSEARVLYRGQGDAVLQEEISAVAQEALRKAKGDGTHVEERQIEE